MSIITDGELQEARKKLQVYLKFWQKNPVSFLYDCKAANVLPYQAEIIHSVVDNKRTIVRSGHGLGKTYIMALTACWWLCTHWIKGEGCSVIVTSPSASNLSTVFLAQLSKCMDLLPPYFKDHFTITSEAIYENEDIRGWRLDLRTARKENPDAMQGQHNVLFLLDEWSGIPIEIYRVVEGSMSDEGSRILAIGNPLRRSGWGYDAFHKNIALWNCIHISGEIYTHDKEFITEYIDILGNTHTDINYGRVDPKEVQKWLDISSGNRDALDFMIRVRGDFPKSGKHQFISLKHVTPCFKQSYYSEQKKIHTLALDPATSGTDDIALVHRWGANLMSGKLWQEEDTMKIAYQVRDWLKAEGKSFRFKFLAVDAIGDGKGVYDKLSEMKENGELINVEQVFSYKSSREANDKERYDRFRDETWQKMKEWFINEKPHFSVEYEELWEELQEEITGLTFDFTTRGALKLESKKDLRKRGVKSPNLGDALAMTFSRHDDIYKAIKLDKYQARLQKWAQKQPQVDWRAV